MPDTPPFRVSPDVVDAVVAHMNADHLGDSLALCRAFAQSPALSAARLVRLDDQGLDFEVEIDEVLTALRIPWSRPLASRADIRAQLKEMTLAARKAPAGPAEPGESGESGAVTRGGATA
jgi:hypothetical protein